MTGRRWPVGAVLLVMLALVAAGCGGGSGSGSGSSTTAAQEGIRLIAPDGLAVVLARERERRAQEGTTTTTTAPAPTSPFPVATTTMTFVDPSRSAPARSGNSSQRTLPTTVYYPASTPPTAEAPTPPAAKGPFPLVVFAHGFAIDAASYATLLREVAAGGYVVAAPDFPGTSTIYAGAADRADTLEQPADLSFVITSLLDASSGSGLLHGTIDPAEVGDMGQSDGGVTALATVANTCCQDPRIKAATILTGGAFGFEGQWFPSGTPPILFVHATADEINPYSASTSMFAQAPSPKYFLTIEGGSHLEVYVDPPWMPQVAAATVAFLDLHLKHIESAAGELTAVGNQPGYTLQTG